MMKDVDELKRNTGSKFILNILMLVFIFGVVMPVAVIAESSDADNEIKIFIDETQLEAKDTEGNRVYPILKDGTTYLPVRAVAAAFGKAVAWDEETNTVYIGVKSDIKETVSEEIKIYIDNVKIMPKDANGNRVYPFINNGTTYLPVRAVGEAFGETVKWDESSNSIYITKNESDVSNSTSDNKKTNSGDVNSEKIEIGKYYKIRAKGTENYLSVKDDATVKHTDIVMAPWKDSEFQKWKITDEKNGYMGLLCKGSGLIVQVSGQSKENGHHLIQWDYGNGDNQKWMIIKEADGSYRFKVKHSGMFMDSSFPNFVAQGTYNATESQQWEAILVTE